MRRAEQLEEELHDALQVGAVQDRVRHARAHGAPPLLQRADEGEQGGASADGESLATRLSTTDNQQSGSDSEYLRQRLTEAFAKLPPILREAYTLFQIGEMSIRDIANQTGVSENLVKVRIFRAKSKLREILADLRVT